MGTYYRIVNHTRREAVSTNDLLGGGGDKENAIISASKALGFLLFGRGYGCEYLGRWASEHPKTPDDWPMKIYDSAQLRGDLIAIDADSDHDWYYEDHDLGYVDITEGLRQAMLKRGWL